MDAQGNFTDAAIRALSERNKVTLYVYAYERRRIPGVDVVYAGRENKHSFKTTLVSWLDRKRLAKALSGYDVLIMTGPDIGLLAAAARAKGVRKMWVYHGLTPAEFLPTFKDRALTVIRRHFYIRSMCRPDTEVVKVDSGFARRELIELGVPSSKIKILPLGVDIARFSGGDRNKIRGRHNIQGAYVLLFVGRLAKSKRVETLFGIMVLLRNSPFMMFTNTRLLIVGAGPEEGRLKNIVSKSGVGDCITFAGRVSDEELPDYYAASDVFITGSVHEDFGVCLVEAMAAGLPCLVPANGSMPEIVGRGGFEYVTPGDACNVLKMLREREFRTYISTAARKRAAEFGMKDVLEKYVALVEGKE